MKTLLRPVFLATALLAAAAMSSCKKPTNEYKPPPPPEVTVASPILKTVPETYESTATIRAFESVEVRARVKGFISERPVKGGDRVKQGDRLFVIDQRPFQAVVRQAEAEVEVRKSNARLAQVTLNRVKEAVAGNAVSKLEQDKAQADYDAALSQVDLAEASLAQAKLNLEYSDLRAPVAGRLSLILPDVGQLVNESDLLCELMNDEKVYANYTMDERTLRRLRERNQNRRPNEDGRSGFKMLLGFPEKDGWPIEGEFAKADVGVNPQTGTIAIDAIFPNAAGTLLPGMFVKVAGILGERTVMLVPDVAVQADQAGRFVFIVKPDAVIERRSVTVGKVTDRMRIIDDGLEETDRVVINGVQRCRPGAKVTVKDATGPAPAAAPAATPTPAN